MRILVYMFCLSLLSTSSVLAAFYKKVNPDGSVEYSDVPQNDASEMDLKPIHTVPAIKLPPAATPKKTEEKEVDFTHYSELKITSPKNDEAIRSNSGNITASASLNPALRSMQEHHIEWWLDGSKIENATGLGLNLENMARGSHQLQVRVVDFDRKPLIESEKVTFHVMRAIIKPKPPAP
ncbi:MAG: DUF4124 domain-containing protein [Gammaproteobacteria bacterium]|nr:DUF4124 domain-containing protein [Gammaproteobacteria bacterium]